MSEKMISAEEHIPPIRLTDNQGIIKNPGDVYELDFSRESVAYSESRGFKLEEVAVYPVTRIVELFYYSFRKNYPRVSRGKIEAFMDAWGGIPESVLKRLIELYSQAATANNIRPDQDEGKNAVGTVEL